MFLIEREFENFVSKMPLVSIDICILKNRKILLGRRKNSPARDFYFVPGGRIRKDEKIAEATDRILIEEIGYKFKDNNNKRKTLLGCYEHFYNDNFQGNSKFGTHYVVLSFVIEFEDVKKVACLDIDVDQHSNYIWYKIDKDDASNLKIHKYTLEYLNELS
jgi:colanic acid biosynthesis protein WcaH